MLYEVITIIKQEGLDPLLQVTSRDRNRLAMQADIVITSYSIHYTKLYEAPRGGPHSAVTARCPAANTFSNLLSVFILTNPL